MRELMKFMQHPGGSIWYHKPELKKAADPRCKKCRGKGYYRAPAGMRGSAEYQCRCTVGKKP